MIAVALIIWIIAGSPVILIIFLLLVGIKAKKDNGG